MVVTLGGINYRAVMDEVLDDDVLIDGDIDGQSKFTLKVNRGNIIVKGKIDGQCTVILEAVEGFITIVDKIDGQSAVTLKASTGISIGGKVDGQVKLKMTTKSGQIILNDKVDGGPRTQVSYHGTTKVHVLGGIRGGALFLPKDWIAEDALEALRAAAEAANIDNGAARK